VKTHEGFDDVPGSRIGRDRRILRFLCYLCLNVGCGVGAGIAAKLACVIDQRSDHA
jgi:hypothetical protein